MEERRAVAQLKQGEIRGLELLVRKYYVQAVRTAFLITRDRPLAEDLVQSAFVRAYARIRQFDANRPFGPWFLRSVVNDAVKAISRGDRRLSLEADEDRLENALPDPTPDPLKLVEQAETRDEVWTALGRLEAAERALVVERYFLEQSETELAVKHASPLGTIKWRLHRARKHLRAWLAPL